MTQARLLLIVMLLGLSACGGGTSGSAAPQSNLGASSAQASSSSLQVVSSLSSSLQVVSSLSSSLQVVSSLSSSASSSQAPLVLQPITRENTPYMVAGVIDAFDLALNMPSMLKELVGQIGLLTDGQYSVACDGGGSYSLAISNGHRTVTETFDDCKSDTDILSGQRHVNVLEKGSGSSQVLIQFDNLNTRSANDPSVYTEFFGSIEYEGEIDDAVDVDRLFQVNLNVYINDSMEGIVSLQDARFQLKYNGSESFFPDKFLSEQSYAGKISWLGKGVANFEFNANENAIVIAGSTDAIAKAVYDKEFFIYWDAQNDDAVEAQLFIPSWEASLDALTTGDRKIVPSGIDGLILENKSLYMSRGQSYEIDLRRALTHSSISLLDYELIVDGNSATSADWSQPELGRFLLNFNSNTEDKTYNLIFRVRDTDKNNTYDLPISFFVGSDFDGDAVPNKYDDDDDNDTVKDISDLYPFDSTEAADTDNDGIPDNQDIDADSDGVPNFADASPLDASNCLTSQTCYAYLRVKPIFLDKDGVLYFESYQSNLTGNSPRTYLPRLDTTTGNFLPLVKLPGSFQNKNLYEPEKRKIYTSDGNNIYITDLVTMQTSPFFQNDRALSIKYVENNHIVIGRSVYGGSSGLSIESYNLDGQMISSLPGDDRLYPVVPPKYARYCDSATTSDAQGNLFLHKNLSESTCSNTVRKISADNKYIYRSGGADESGIYSTLDGSLLIPIPNQSQLYWVASGYVLHNQYGDGVMELHNESGALVQTFSISDTEFFMGLYTNDTRIVLQTLTSESGRTNIRVFDESLTLLGTYGY